jgi:biopolymer transport protein ExbD
MRIKKSKTEQAEADMTPMIDIVFQLVAFFMVLINFAQTEDHARVKLPKSELAKPVEEPPDYDIILHVSDIGTVFLNGQEHEVENIGPYLNSEKDLILAEGVAVADAVIVIRGHEDAQSGKIQELINVCQENDYETFALRAKEDVNNF